MGVMPDPATAAANWAQKLGASGTKWVAGVNGVTVAPGQLAARASALWLQNTTAAQAKFVRNSQAVSLQDWQQMTIAKGQTRLASGATAAQSKVETAFSRLFPYIQQQVNSLPPRGDLEANIARMDTFVRGMAKYATTG